MMITKKSHYAVIAIIDIAEHKSSGLPVKISDISKRQNISQMYLEQIFTKLKKANLVISIKGPGGGYLINKDLNQISIIDIVDAVHEATEMTMCSLNSTDSCNHRSKKGQKCVIHNLWGGLTRNIRSYLSSISIYDIINNNNQYINSN